MRGRQLIPIFGVWLLAVWMFLPPQPALGQPENSIWYFGRNAGIRFDGGQPVALPGGRTNSGAGAVVSDDGGNLLFYTDGRTVWDRRHQVMPNGEGLLAAADWPQSVAIVPVLRAPGQYFVFTISAPDKPAVLRYSIVDLNRNGGYGTVLPEKKNQVLRDSVYPVLTTVKADCGVWLITLDQTVYNSSVFVAYPINFSGIDFPVVTSYGVLRRGERGLNRALLKPSPDGSRLIIGANYVTGSRWAPPGPLDDYFFAFGFLPENGKVFLRDNNLDGAGFQDILGMEYSSDGRWLYTNERIGEETRGIFQYDLSAGSGPAIAATRREVGRASEACGTCLGALAAGPDGRIYVARDGQQYLGVIRPAVGEDAAGYQDEGVWLGPGVCRQGLPNRYIPHFQMVDPLALRDTLNCRGDTIRLSAAPGYAAYRWQDGATGPDYLLTGPGRYILEASFANCLVRDTVDMRAYIHVDGLLGPDTVLCSGESLHLDATAAGGTGYRWNDGPAGSVRNLDRPGTYWIEFSDGECTRGDTLRVEKYEPVLLELGMDTTLCRGETLRIDPQAAGATSFRWSDGSTGRQLTVSSPAEVRLEVAGPGNCLFTDSLLVSFVDPPSVDLGPDRSMCEGQTATLQVSAGAPAALRWQDGSADSKITVTESGVYSVTATAGRCRAADEVRIEFRDCCTLYRPNAFSPDGDGINDRFSLDSGCPLVEYRLRIFSRLGQLLFESTDVGAGWDGFFGNRPAPPGVYVYLVDFAFERDGGLIRRQEAGDVTLLR